MPTLNDIFIINSNTADAVEVPSGRERTLCGDALCGSRNLTVIRRTVSDGRTFHVEAGGDVHLLYVMGGGGSISLGGESVAAEGGAGAMVTPGETADFAASGGDLEILHMITPKAPAGVDGDLPGGPGYVFNRGKLRRLSDASGGRVRHFCAESTVRLGDGSRLTPTNAIQAGEMHYRDGGSSPYHQHVGTEANPRGPDHCYMTFTGRGKVEVGDESQELEPGTLVYFPPSVPHRLRALDGPLDYFEIQAWRSFKTNVLSEEELGLKWYYDAETEGGERAEWDQS